MFQEILGGSKDYDGSFRIEGITITIPAVIGFHRDSLNCNRKGMHSVVSLNVNVPINNDTVPPASKLRLWMDANGFTHSFPLSIIYYSRRMNFHYGLKISKSVSLANENTLFQLVDWMLRKRVGSVVDYQSTVWGNTDFAKEFLKRAKVKKGSRFGGRMTTTTETIDKIVSTT